jgi:hypothetical protein
MQETAKRFKAPAACHKDCRTAIVKEMSGDDDIAAAVAADQKRGSPGFKADNFTAMMKLERQERIRQSIVAVDDRPMKPGNPCPQYEKFGAKTKLWLSKCFDAMNGLEESELEKSVAEAEIVDLSRPITGEASDEEQSDASSENGSDSAGT